MLVDAVQKDHHVRVRPGEGLDVALDVADEEEGLQAHNAPRVRQRLRGVEAPDHVAYPCGDAVQDEDADEAPQLRDEGRLRHERSEERGVRRGGRVPLGAAADRWPRPRGPEREEEREDDVQGLERDAQALRWRRRVHHGDGAPRGVAAAPKNSADR